jgi:hypothetical protein
LDHLTFAAIFFEKGLKGPALIKAKITTGDASFTMRSTGTVSQD